MNTQQSLVLIGLVLSVTANDALDSSNEANVAMIKDASSLRATPRLDKIRQSSVSDAFPLEMQCALGVLILLAAITYVVTKKPQSQKGGADSAVQSANIFSTDAVLFAVYVVLWTSLKFLVSLTKDIPHSVMLFLFMISLVKLLTSIVMYISQDGAFSELISTIASQKKMSLMYVVPAVLYTVSDVLLVLCLHRVDPVTVTLLYNFRNVAIACIWTRMFNKSLTWTQIVGFSIMCAGLLAKELLPNRGATVASGARSEFYVLILFGALCSTGATLWNEKMLKESPMPINAQNFVMYVYCTLFSLSGHIVYSSWDKNAGGLPFGSTRHEQVLYWSSVVVFAVFGIATSYFLKRLGNIVRVASNAATVVTSMPLQVVILNYTFLPIEFACVMAILLGLGTYAMGGESASKDAKPTEKTPLKEQA